MSKKFSVRALMIKQTKRIPLYLFFLKGQDILKIADISRIRKANDDELLGYQRGEVQHHVNEIAEYLNSKEVLFPNAIILAMSSEVRFKKSRGPSIGDGSSVAGVLEIPIRTNGQKVAWIVDGQQRTLALMKCKNNNVVVPLTGFVSDDFEVHRTQFLLVNKVKPLPAGLINELLPVVNTALPPSLAKNRIPSALCNILNKDPESPFKDLIIRQSTDRRKNKQAVIADNSLIQVIRNSLNSVHGCLYQYKNVATGEIDVERVRKTLNLYWTEVKKLFPDAWGKPPLSSRLMHGVGIRAMGALMDRIMCNINPDKKTAQEKVRKALLPIKSHCAWTEGCWDQLNGVPWNYLQNTPRDKNLLTNMLVRVYLGVNS
ncbi:MAG: DGQHR domain-containing protein [Planctomycetes bacterium]|nr:DGQHR domain-containing protein [Planctomycetota bacterium]